MVLNAVVQMLREAEELKQNIFKFKSETSMLQERSLWTLQQQLQKIYQKVLILDLDHALDKKVEQDLWNIGFKQQIEALQAISKDRKSPLRSEGQAMLSWVLQAAGGFYLCLLHQICTAFKLDLPFRRRASLLGWVEGWSPIAPGDARLPPPAAARYICQHCLVHLGDLARYRQQPRVAYTFYRHALVVSTHSGQPYNQLALLARRRGRRLGALYWHVRAILVRAPFPPAPANLARTLKTLAGHVPRDVPVLHGPARKTAPAQAHAPPRLLDAHSHETELLRALHAIHSGESLDLAEQLVEILNTSLTSLVATDSFESTALIKMMCILIWLVHHTTEELSVSSEALSESEASAATLSQTLVVGALLALLLPSHTADSPPSRALPALKVCLQWMVLYPQLLDTEPFQSRPQIWHALAHTLNKLTDDSTDKCETVPLPEDEELHGFQPLEQSFEDLKFSNHTAWDTYGRRLPEVEDEKPLDQDVPPPSVVSPTCLSGDPELEAAVRAHRLIKLGMRLAELRPELFSFSTDDNDVPTFTALCHGGEQLSRSIAQLRQTQSQSQDSDGPVPLPVVISEADFREKVRDKRVGILKPQGSLERAREERALATADDQDPEELTGEGSKNDDRREQRRPRVNIAMAAILRKQEESCKQVKFRTPPPVPKDTELETLTEAPSATENTTPSEREKPVQAKPKSLSETPSGRQPGGILKLKDNSGYPHLAVTEPEMKRKDEKPPQKDPKVIQPPSQKQQREPNKWHQQSFDQARPGQRNYGLQTAGISYNPNYQAPTQEQNQSIRLPVVNPKEIDVLGLRQNSRTEYSHPRNTNYPMSSDKKNFLRDLPPRFANQRYSQESEQNQFKDENNSNLFNMTPWLSQTSSRQIGNQRTSHMPGPVPGQISGQMTGQLPGQLTGQFAEQLSIQLGNQRQLASQIPNQFSSQLPGQLSSQDPGQLSAQLPGQFSSQHPGQLSSQLPGQFSSQRPGQLSSQLPGQSSSQLPGQMSAQIPSQLLGQLPGQMPIPPYSSGMEPYIPQWWKNQTYAAVTTATTVTVTADQLYGQTGPDYQQLRNEPTESTLMGQSAIGQMTPRHAPQPSYNPLGFSYPQYSAHYRRGFLDQNYPAPLEYGRFAPPPSEQCTFEPNRDSKVHYRRRGDGALERVTEAEIETHDLMSPKETVERDTQEEDPAGTYSLFSGAPGAVAWGAVAKTNHLPQELYQLQWVLLCQAQWKLQIQILILQDQILALQNVQMLLLGILPVSRDQLPLPSPPPPTPSPPPPPPAPSPPPAGPRAHAPASPGLLEQLGPLMATEPQTPRSPQISSRPRRGMRHGRPKTQLCKPRSPPNV